MSGGLQSSGWRIVVSSSAAANKIAQARINEIREVIRSIGGHLRRSNPFILINLPKTSSEKQLLV